MLTLSRIPRRARLSVWLLPVLLMACQSSPTELYVLSPQAAALVQNNVATARVSTAGGTVRQRPVDTGTPRGTLGVAVTVPEYLDRLDIIERTGANELKPNYKAQWGENLSVDAARVIVEDLEILLPSASVVLLPSRTHHALDYEINIDLLRFEGDGAGNTVTSGAWTVSAGGGHELAGGRFHLSVPIGSRAISGMAAAMSRDLAAVSADLALALKRLSPSFQEAWVIDPALPKLPKV